MGTIFELLLIVSIQKNTIGRENNEYTSKSVLPMSTVALFENEY